MSLARYAPWFGFKNFLMRRTGAGIGKNVSLAFGVQLDILFPGDIIIEDDAIIGYNTTILCHGYLHDSYQRGPVLIGERASIGANSTILPGVTIGDDAVVGAMSLVREDVPPGEFWAGVPAKRIRNRY